MYSKLRFALVLFLFVLAACGGDDTTETGEDAGPGADATNNTSPNANTGNDDAGDSDGGRDTGGDAGTCDDDPPSVSINPPSPVMVGFDEGSTTIRLDFDESVTGLETTAFEIDNGATIESVGGAEDVYDVTVSGLSASTTYTLTLNDEAVVDECGNALDEPLVITIEVGSDPCDSDDTPPTFTVQPTPPIEVMSGTTSTSVTLLFSEEIQGVSPTVDNGASVGGATNPQGNDWVVEVSGLTDGVTTVTVPTSTLDACGNAMAMAESFEIIVGTSDSTAPMVVSSVPNNGESGVALDSDIVFEFSEPMDTSAGSIDLTASGNNATFNATWSNGDRTLTIDPDTDFANGDGVVAVLNNFSDVAGNALPNEVLAFTAIPDPCVFDTTAPVFSTTPAAPIRLAPGVTSTTFVLNFSEAVTGVTAAALSASGSANISSVTSNGNNYSVTVTNLAVGSNLVTVPTSVADQCGNALSSAQTVEIVGRSNDQTPPTVASTSPVAGATNVSRSTDIVITWNEAMNQTGGFATVRVNGSSVNRTLSWDNASTLRLDPAGDLPFGSTVTVFLSSFSDANGNSTPLEQFSFTVEPDPCAVYPPSVSVISTDQDGILADTSGEVWALVELSDLFQLGEAQLSVTPVTGSGTLAAGSLTGTNDTFAFRITGTAPGDSYTVSVGTGTSNNGCTTLAASSYEVDVPDSISVGGTSSDCPLPAQAASHYGGGDACNGTVTNDSPGTAEQTGLVLDAIGDRISFGGVYDSDQSSDSDYFQFEVVEDGVTSKDLLIEFHQGCDYTGTPGSSTSADFEVRFETGQGSFIGDTEYTVPKPRAAFDQNVAGVVRATRTVDGPAGTNSYNLHLNEQVGGVWCSDWIAIVEVVDTGRPASCANTTANVSIENVPQVAYANEFTQEAEIEINLSSSFGSLTPQDIAVIPLGAARGSLKPGTLAADGTGYTAQLGGVQAGETYLVTLSTGATSCTMVEGSGFYVTISDDPLDAGDGGACPLPAPLAQNHFGADLCNTQTNGTLATSDPTGFTLQNVGDNFSVQGTLDTDFITGSDDDWFSFEIDENGSNIYSLDLMLIYGCEFPDASGTNDPFTLRVVDDAGNELGEAVGTELAPTSGDSWRAVSGTVEVANVLGGPTTYHLEVDGQGSFGLCMDFIAYVELTDISGDAQCLGRTANASLTSTTQSSAVSGTRSSVNVSFDSGYSLTSGDISVTPVTGTGTYDVASFQQLDSSTYRFDIAGVASGDEYTVNVAGGTDACGTTFAADSIQFLVQNLPDTNGSCPLPPPLPNHFASGETCSDTDSNGSRASAFDTGFTLQDAGDAFSIGSNYDTSGTGSVDYDYFAFEVNNTTSSTFSVNMRMVYGCGFSGSISTGDTDSPILELHTTSGTQVGTDLTTNLSHSTISAQSSYGYGERTLSFTPTSGRSTYYLRVDDVVGSGFCYDYQLYVTLESKN